MSAVLSPTWSSGRRAAAGTFAVVIGAGLVALAVYSSAVLFLLLNKVDPRPARLTSIVRYWELYQHDARLRHKLIGSMATSALAWLFVLPIVAVLGSRRRRPLHGDARFATAGEVAQAGLLLTDGRQRSILIGRHRSRFIALPGQLSAMLSAPTRSGKGVGVVIPNLLNWPDSVVVLDIKGENHAVTAGYRARCGQAVYAFAPFSDDARSHRWNPLTAVRTSELHRVGDLLAIGQVFFPTEGNTSSEAFFNDQARNLFLGIGLYLLETPELPRTVGEMLRQSSGQGRTFKEHFQATLDQRAKQDMPLSAECTDALQRLLANSDNTLTSIVSTFNAPLTVFADAIVDAATSGDDFDLADLRRRSMSVYVLVPPHRLASARPLLNLFFSQLVSLNTQARQETDPTLKLQCLLVHDEFTSMGRVGVIASAAAFLAGYNLRLLTVVQAMSQLDAVYGEKEARTFATNHGLQILFAPREQRDADEYSAMLGNFTERATSRGRSRSFGQHGHNTLSRNESDQRRALLLPQEFKELGSERLVAIVENCKPILGDKIRYHREPVFRARLLPPPALPAMDMDLHFAKAQRRWRYVDDEIDADTTLSVERLAHNVTDIDRFEEAPSPEAVRHAIDQFLDMTRVPDAGGAIESMAAIESATTTVAEERAPAAA